MNWIVESGKNLYGPFKSAGAAASWAIKNLSGDTWAIRRLSAP